MTYDNLIKRKKDEHPLITWTRRKIQRNQNRISLTFGATGSGKSYRDISEALKIDPDFNVEKQVVFSLKQLMELLNDKEFKRKKWKVVIFEEAQITISNRAWQSAINKMLNYVLSTFRHQNIILMFNAPYRDFLDSQAMKLVHITFEVKGFNKKTELCLFHIKVLDYNSKMSKTYEHSLHYIDFDNYIYKLKRSKFTKPPKDVCDKYEQKKTEFTTTLNKSIMIQANKMDQAENSQEEKDDPTREGTFKQREAKKLYVKYKGNIKKISKELKITIHAIYERLGGKGGMADLREYGKF